MDGRTRKHDANVSVTGHAFSSRRLPATQTRTVGSQPLRTSHPQRIPDYMDQRCGESLQRRCPRRQGLLVGFERLSHRFGGAGSHQTVSAGQDDDECAYRNRRARKGYRIKAVAIEHQRQQRFRVDQSVAILLGRRLLRQMHSNQLSLRI